MTERNKWPIEHKKKTPQTLALVVATVSLVVATCLSAGCRRYETVHLEFSPGFHGAVVVIYGQEGGQSSKKRRYSVPVSGIVVIKERQPDNRAIDACERTDASHCRPIDDGSIAEFSAAGWTKYKDNEPIVRLKYDTFVLKRPGNIGPVGSNPSMLAYDALEGPNGLFPAEGSPSAAGH